MITIEWSEVREPEEVFSVDRLLLCAREIASETSSDHGIGIDLLKSSGESLLAIVAGDQWWFTWFPPEYSEDGLGSYHSTSSEVGSIDVAPLSPENLVPYFFLGNHGEVFRHEGVHERAGLSIIAEFFSNDGRPSTVGWLPD